MVAPRQLDSLTIRKPCTASWEAMEPVAGGRQCALCERPVHDLSALTRSEAEALVLGAPRGLCVRIVRDAEGRIVTRAAGGRSAPRGALERLRSLLLGGLSMLAAACGAGPDQSRAIAPRPEAASPGVPKPDVPSEEQLQLLAQLGGLGYDEEGAAPSPEPAPEPEPPRPPERCPKQP